MILAHVVVPVDVVAGEPALGDIVGTAEQDPVELRRRLRDPAAVAQPVIIVEPHAHMLVEVQLAVLGVGERHVEVRVSPEHPVPVECFRLGVRGAPDQRIGEDRVAGLHMHLDGQRIAERNVAAHAGLDGRGDVADACWEATRQERVPDPGLDLDGAEQIGKRCEHDLVSCHDMVLREWPGDDVRFFHRHERAGGVVDRDRPAIPHGGQVGPGVAAPVWEPHRGTELDLQRHHGGRAVRAGRHRHGLRRTSAGRSRR